MKTKEGTFAHIIRNKRKEKGFTQIQLSEKLGLGLETFKQVEQGRTPSERVKKVLTNWLQS